MGKMLQVRNVPDEIHRTLKARAALAGLSLSDYVLAEIRRLAERPTLEDLMRRLGSRRPVDPRPSAAEIIRRERDAR